MKFPATIYTYEDKTYDGGEGDGVERMLFLNTVEECVSLEEGAGDGLLIAVYELKKLVRAKTTVTITEEKNGGRKQRQRSTAAKQKSA